ncbi:MAG: hypothetical protein IPJ30_11485 [Acidobacteria bacterium]|nr:hypothetical protein [Acidobacteriota bacterium]
MKTLKSVGGGRRAAALALIVLAFGTIFEAFVSADENRSGRAGFASPTPKKKRKQKPKDASPMIVKKEEPTPTPETRTAVAVGTWGADGARLTVGGDSSTLEFGCSSGEINERLLTDSAGRFSAAVAFIRRRPGVQRDGEEPQRLAAKFAGTVTGKTMNLKMTLIESGETIGEYVFEQGRNVRIQRCL